jgi:hypothetical protein
MNATGVSRNLSANIGGVSRNFGSGNGVTATSPSVGFLGGMGTTLLVIIALMIVMAFYYETIGYYVSIGWNKLMGSRARGETVEIGVPGTGLHAKLQPAGDPAFPGGDKPSSVVGSLDKALQRLETDVDAALGDTKAALGGAQVFNVNRNVYTFGEAEPLCRAFGAELATYDQVKDAYEAGADWCNYGWVKGQMAIYPTQESTYEKLQHGPESERMSCGRPGVNGGYFPNAEQRFGVTCYGKRPAESALDERLQMEGQTDTAYDREVTRFKSELDSIPVTPWNHDRWSQ